MIPGQVHEVGLQLWVFFVFCDCRVLQQEGWCKKEPQNTLQSAF